MNWVHFLNGAVRWIQGHPLWIVGGTGILFGIWFVRWGHPLFNFLFGESQLDINLDTASFHVVLQSHNRVEQSHQNQGVDYVLITLQGRVHNNYGRTLILKNPGLICPSLPRLNGLTFEHHPRTNPRFHNRTRIRVKPGGAEDFVLRRTIENFTLFDGISELEAELRFDLPYGREHVESITLTRTQNSNLHRDIQNSLSPNTQWGSPT